MELWWSISIGAFFYYKGTKVGPRKRIIGGKSLSYSMACFQNPYLNTNQIARTRQNKMLKKMINCHNTPVEAYATQSSGDEDVPAALADETKIMFAYHPHGVYAFGLFSLVFGMSSGFQDLFLHSKGVLVGVANVFRIYPYSALFCLLFLSRQQSLNKACETDLDIVVVPGV